MAAISEHASSTLQIEFTTLDQNGAAKNITGATITAVAKNYSGTEVSGTTAITDATAGVFTVDFATTDLSAGIWSVQARAVIGDESQVVAEKLVEIAPAHV